MTTKRINSNTKEEKRRKSALVVTTFMNLRNVKLTGLNARIVRELDTGQYAVDLRRWMK